MRLPSRPSNSQAMPSLSAARGNHLAPPLGAHADQEAMSTLAAHNRWLECAFHFTKSLKSMRKNALFDLFTATFVKSNFSPPLWISFPPGGRMLRVSAAESRRFDFIERLHPYNLPMSGAVRAYEESNWNCPDSGNPVCSVLRRNYRPSNSLRGSNHSNWRVKKRPRTVCACLRLIVSSSSGYASAIFSGSMNMAKNSFPGRFILIWLLSRTNLLPIRKNSFRPKLPLLLPMTAGVQKTRPSETARSLPFMTRRA